MPPKKVLRQYVKSCFKRGPTSKMNIKALLKIKPREAGTVLQRLEDAERRLEDVRANSAAPQGEKPNR